MFEIFYIRIHKMEVADRHEHQSENKIQLYLPVNYCLLADIQASSTISQFPPFNILQLVVETIVTCLNLWYCS